MWKIAAAEGKEHEIREHQSSSLQWKEGNDPLGVKVAPVVGQRMTLHSAEQDTGVVQGSRCRYTLLSPIDSSLQSLVFLGFAIS